MSYSVRATTATVACCHARGEELDGHLLKKMERTNDKRWTDGSIIYCINVFFGFDFRVVSCEMSCCCCTVAWLVLLSVMPIFGFRLPCCGGFGVCSAQPSPQSHRQHNTTQVGKVHSENEGGGYGWNRRLTRNRKIFDFIGNFNERQRVVWI